MVAGGDSGRQAASTMDSSKFAECCQTLYQRWEVDETLGCNCDGLVIVASHRDDENEEHIGRAFALSAGEGNLHTSDKGASATVCVFARCNLEGGRCLPTLLGAKDETCLDLFFLLFFQLRLPCFLHFTFASAAYLVVRRKDMRIAGRDEGGAGRIGSAGTLASCALPKRDSAFLVAGMWQLKHSEWLMAFTEGCIFMLANSERAKNSINGMIELLPATFTKRVEVLTRDKSDKNKSNFGLIIAGLKASKRGSKVGCARADNSAGSFAPSWERALGESGLEVADVTDDLWEVVTAHKRPEVR